MGIRQGNRNFGNQLIKELVMRLIPIITEEMNTFRFPDKPLERFITEERLK